MSDTPVYHEPSGSAEERMERLGHLEDGEAAKAADQPFYENVNHIMLGGDIGWATASVLDAGITAGASGSAIAGALAVELAPVAIAIGGAWALDKLGATDAMSRGFVWVGDELGLTIGRGDPHPACVGDAVAHSMGAWGIFGGMLVGVAVGAIVAAAVVATVATGGLAGAMIVGACMAGGLSLGSALASASQQMGSDCGQIMTGSHDVYFEGRRVARVTDLVKCDQHSGVPQPLVEGSRTVFVNDLPLVRIGHETYCSAKVNAGRKSIWIDKTTGQYGPKKPELTAGEEFWASLLGGLAGGAVGRTIGKGFKPKSTESAEQSGVKDSQSKCVDDPVDVATGEVLEVRVDLAIPGVLPLELKRRYRTRSDDDGLLGHRWSDNWSQCLTFDGGRFVRFHDGAGLVIGFDAPGIALDGINLREPRYRLIGSRLEPRILDRDTRQLHIFSPLVDGRSSRLERIEDLDGNAIAFSYDAAGRLSGLAHSHGYRLEVVYHGRGRRPEQIVLDDADGGRRTLVDYGYQGGMLASVASFQFGRFHYAYDEHGWMTQWRDTDQTDVRYQYDTVGRVVETGTRQGYHTGRFSYEIGRTRVFDADGEWIYDHNGEGLVTAETDPLGHCTRSEWELGRLMARIDPLGRRTVYRYDDIGQLISITESSGRVIDLEYDEQRLTTVSLPNGGRIRLEYDHLHRLIARTEPDGARTTYRYGSRGELLRVVQGDRETRLDYDRRLRLTDIELPGGARFRRRSDVLGRVLEETSPDGDATGFDYTDGPDNPRGRLVAVTHADGSVSRAQYNSESLLVGWTDPLGRTVRRTYGPFDLLVASIDAAGHETRFEYDHATRLTKVVDAVGDAYIYRYDAAGRLMTEIDWGGRVTAYQRDAAGRLLVKTLPDGGQWRYTYDAQDRLTEVDAGDVRLLYRYDLLGRLASAEVRGEQSHVTRFAYDGNGRLVGEDQHGELLRHVYDADGRRRRRMTPRRETAYAYDELGALTLIGGLTIHRDSLGRETGRQVGEFAAQRQYDALGRLRRQVAGPAAAIEALQADPAHALEQLTRQVYHYDAAGQLERVDTDADTRTYRRDVRGQVVLADSLLQQAEHYRYDAAMNILAHGRQAPVDVHHYGRGGLPERIGHARYRYDARGRTIEKTIEQPGFRPKTWQYTWDGLNRLVKVVTPERGVWLYRYDAFNRRVAKQQIGGRETMRFLWDGSTMAERWVEQRDGTTGQVVTWHIEPGSFSPLAQETDEGLYAVLTDQVGLPTEVFDGRGQSVWKASYSLWGKLLPARRAANDACGTSIDTTLRFPGQWADDETGLNYNLNRYYDPDSGQYLSVDPIGLAGGIRTHGYVANPTQWVDPLGLSGCEFREFLKDKWGRKDVEDALAAKRGNAVLDKLLTDNEYLAIRGYTSNLYEEINPALRAGNPGEWGRLTSEASNGLSKLADNGYAHVGDVVRNLRLTNEQVEQLFPVGGVFQDKAFLSTTTDLDGVFPGKVTMNIASRSGVKVSSLSEFPREAEVLFKPDTPFKVLDRTHDPANGSWNITLEEQ
ncbi:RHS repeat-associated core domain-containing protein [Burkholderia pyrrocinia]|uniref:RHS repeat-associated core domain-containing protein n=1 Tax=Burkholderia pyrrocinia TaxID=60550 RepID=UPI00064C0EC5|nr:RHS repeat-associated core domain-containing protein [Burkholderia pyrrocinia]AKM03221.1 membrane protein [Burkholderia pyrrocinia]